MKSRHSASGNSSCRWCSCNADLKGNMSGFVQRARNLLHLGAERDAAFLDETSPSVVGSADDETAKQLGAVEGYVGISRTTAYQTMEGVGGAITWYGIVETMVRGFTIRSLMLFWMVFQNNSFPRSFHISFLTTSFCS